MNGGYFFHLEEPQTVACNRVIVWIFTEEKGVKNFYGILENARGKCLHQVFN